MFWRTAITSAFRLQKIRCLIERASRLRARRRSGPQSFTDKARAIIGEFPESPDQRAMSALTELITDRDH